MVTPLAPARANSAMVVQAAQSWPPRRRTEHTTCPTDVDDCESIAVHGSPRLPACSQALRGRPRRAKLSRSPSRRVAFAPRVGTRRQRARSRVDHDAVEHAEPPLLIEEAMPCRGEPRPRVL